MWILGGLETCDVHSYVQNSAGVATMLNIAAYLANKSRFKRNATSESVLYAEFQWLSIE